MIAALSSCVVLRERVPPRRAHLDALSWEMDNGFRIIPCSCRALTSDRDCGAQKTDIFATQIGGAVGGPNCEEGTSSFKNMFGYIRHDVDCAFKYR